MSQALNYGFVGDQAYADYYRPTGKVTAAGLIAGGGGGGVAAVLVPLAYQWLIEGRLLGPFAAALPFAVGALLGGIVGVGMHAGRARNAPLTMAMAGLVAAVAYGLCWSAHVCALIDRYMPGGLGTNYLTLPLHPRLFFRLVHLAAEARTASWPLLTILWGGEALGFLGTAIWVAKTLAIDAPFCERCRRWSGKPTMIAALDVGDDAAARAALEAHDWEYVRAAMARPVREAFFWSLLLGRCATCEGLNLLTLNEVRVGRDKHGRLAIQTRPIVDRLRIAHADVDVILTAAATLVADTARNASDDDERRTIAPPV